MMLSIMQNSTYNPETGQVTVNLTTSTNAGYPNSCQQYNDYGHISVPLPNQIVNVDAQSLSNVVVTGYNNTITDPNFMINAGESCNYSTKWYHVVANSGIYFQPVETATKENAMMGQSTNHVISDILALLVDICNYLTTHTHANGNYNIPGVGNVVGVSGVPTQTTPDDSKVVQDKSYISGNHNLAITGTYNPYG